MRDGRPEQAATGTSRGVGIRVLAQRGGRMGWGFACTPEVTEGALAQAAARALRIALAASDVAREKVTFPEEAGTTGTYETPVARDPFTVPLDEKMALLDAPVRELLRGGKPIASADAWMEWVRVEKRLLTTEGTDTTQRFTYGGAGMQVLALGDDGVSQRRSYPTLAGLGRVSGWLRADRRARSHGQHDAAARGGHRAPVGAAVSRGQPRSDPRREPGGLADPRVVRAPDGARSGARS